MWIHTVNTLTFIINCGVYCGGLHNATSSIFSFFPYTHFSRRKSTQSGEGGFNSSLNLFNICEKHMFYYQKTVKSMFFIENTWIFLWNISLFDFDIRKFSEHKKIDFQLDFHVWTENQCSVYREFLAKLFRIIIALTSIII